MAQAMTATEARKVFDDIIAGETDPEQVAKLELTREYLCNPAFRAALEEYTFRVNMARA